MAIKSSGIKKTFAVACFLLQFFPLTIFLMIALQHGTPQPADWLNAFVWGGSMAILQFALLLSGKNPLNRIVLGVNLYLIFAGIAAFTGLGVLLKILDDLKESAVFLSILAVGICTTITSKFGFVGTVEIASPKSVKTYSLLLLLLAFMAVVASFWFKGALLFSAAIPLICMSVANRLFKWQLQRKSGMI